nr:heavy metal-associated isoprenylated plant protein 47 [Quercus suber]
MPRRALFRPRSESKIHLETPLLIWVQILPCSSVSNGFFFVGTTLHKERPHTHYPIIGGLSVISVVVSVMLSMGCISVAAYSVFCRTERIFCIICVYRRQKIVTKVQMNSGKCQTKALRVAAIADGVYTVGLEGAEKDEVVVIGEGVNVVKLITTMRKKVGHTIAISVAEEKKGD